MRFAILFPLALTALLILGEYVESAPQARADDETQAPPPKPDVDTGLRDAGPWETHAKTFDLDGDGRITWEEYQQVTSGFAFLDADKDGVVTKSDVDALDEKLAKGVRENHAAVFLGTPGGGFHQVFGGPRGDDASGWRKLLPRLLGGHGGPGMHGTPWTPDAGPMHGMTWRVGMGPMHGARGMQGGPGCFGQPGCRTWTGVQILPWLFSGAQGGMPPAPPPAPPGKPGDAEDPLASALAELLPESLKHFAAFGLVARRADANGDRVITREEWAAAVRTLTKEDGSLDLAGLTKSLGIHGMPVPGGDTALLETLLDTNGDGQVDAQDLDGVFEKADKNGDGKVDHTELMPAGLGGMAVPHGR